MPDKLENLKELQKFLGLINYARPFLKNIGKIAGPLNSKIGKNGQRFFNIEDINLVRKIKNMIKNILPLQLSLESDYLILETDGCDLGWGGILKSKPHKYSPTDQEKLCRYSSGIYKEKGYKTSLDCEILAIIYTLDAFKLFIISKKEFTIRTDSEAIVKYSQNMKEKSRHRRWQKFSLSIAEYNINFEHIKRKDNRLADELSGKIYNI
ncbi:hypothetical protein ACH5RR_033818 [Cinchona calisaya]|uniref:RNase H type-1 domain-containing protein n=1 Tax=Cinchona calisaya TaxID=153742 RepID=A0ABD2YC23_9GENT